MKRVTKKEEEEDEFSFFFLHFIACPHPPFSFPFLGRRIFVVPFRCKPTSLSLYQHAATHSRLTLPSFHLLYNPPPPLRIRNSESYGRIEATIVMQSKLMLCLYRWLARAGDGLFFFVLIRLIQSKGLPEFSLLQYIAHILYKMVVTFFFFFSFFF